jgi:hypothetical protein
MGQMDYSPSEARGGVIKLAIDDPPKAMAAALAISDPWYGSQALAWVGRYWPGDDFLTVLDKALEVSRNQPDPYRVVAVSAWPIRAFIERGAPNRIKVLVPSLCELSDKIENLGSRSNALLLLLESTIVTEKEIWLPVLHKLLDASFPVINWRQATNLRHAIFVLFSVDRELAQEVLNKLPDHRLKGRIENRLKEIDIGHYLPRLFFWVRTETV